jgi:hypothetical protein
MQADVAHGNFQGSSKWSSVSITIGIAVSILMVLALLSCLVTMIQWEGGVGAREVRLAFVDSGGSPVEGVGATLPVTGERRGGIISEFLAGDVKSDASGEIRMHPGLTLRRYGGHACMVFGFIPIGFQTPEFVCAFRHPSYQPLQLSTADLFEEGAGTPDGVAEWTDEFGETMSVQVFRRTLRLEKAKGKTSQH